MRELNILSFPWVVRGNECVFYFPRAPRTRSEGVPRVPACWQGSFNWAIKTIYQWGCVGEFCFMATKKPRRSLSPLTLSIVRKSQSYCSKKKYLEISFTCVGLGTNSESMNENIFSHFRWSSKLLKILNKIAILIYAWGKTGFLVIISLIRANLLWLEFRNKQQITTNW